MKNELTKQGHRLPIGWYQKIPMRIRFSSVLLAGFLMQANAESLTMNTNFMNQEVQRVSVEQVLNQIEATTEYSFIFNHELVNVERLVPANVASDDIESVLHNLFDGSDISYKIVNKQIILSPATMRSRSNEVQQDKQLKGKVVDATGEVVIGANVRVKGTTTGTITDLDGNFVLDVPQNAIIEVSFVGYGTQTVKTQGKSNLIVTLKEDKELLEEVVVVGYGVQKKVNLTGSVSNVDNKKISERPTTNVATLLQGQVSGLSVTQNTGQPGAEGTNLELRGMGTFSAAGTSPMVLVDGVPGSLSALSPDQIETISVLKDAASAAIYGSRAANGVILVTTKGGKKGKTQVSYHVNVGWQQATVLPELISNSVEYMEMYNQMADRTKGKRKYPAEYIDLYRDPNRNKLLYPDYDWIGNTFRTAFTHNHNVTASGGNDKVLYNVNFSYMNQEGILPGHNYERFTGRSNIEAKIHEKVKLGARVAFYNGNVEAPAFQNDAALLQIVQQRPMYGPYLPDGSGRYTYIDRPVTMGGEKANRNPVYIANETSNNTDKWRWDAQAYLDVELFKNENVSVLWNSKAALSFTNNFTKKMEGNDSEGYYYHPINGEYVVGDNFNPSPDSGVKDTFNKSKNITLYSTINYNHTIGKHDWGLLAGVNGETYKNNSLFGRRKWFPSYNIEELNGGSPIEQELGGNSGEWGILSFFGRMNYSYASKYLFEANFRYDGTSRIYKDNRWGIFPSFSGAWRISEESFIKDNCSSWLNNLKLRASWGKLGNQEIGNYAYHDVYSSSNVVIGGDMLQGMTINSLTDKSLSWEETSITDFGVDLNLFNGKLNVTFDWYNKITSGILNTAPIPASVGLGAPVVNYGKLRNRGVEFQIGHQNTIKDFTYGVNFMATLNKNKVLELRAPSYGTHINEVGLPYGEHYMWEWIGLFQSEEEIKNSAKHPYKVLPGDLKLKDQNEDGVIDGKDRIVVSGRHPKMLYSFNINLGYKNFDVSAFFQGVTGRKNYTCQYIIEPFAQGGAPTVDYRDAWTPENTDTDVPALYEGIPKYKAMNNRSTFFLRDASYLRLKNLQVGYNFPKNWINKIGLKSLRLYFSGENLLTFSDYPHGDPERLSEGRHAVYPQLKTYSLGLDVKF